MSMGTKKHLKSAQGLCITNPTHIGSNGMDLSSTLTTTVNGSYSFATSGSTNTVTGNSSKFANGGSNIPTPTSYIDRLELKMYKQSIRIIQLENKLDSEECENLKKMLMSNDEASIILAKEIIDNLETT